MTYCKTAVTPLLTQWSYCSLPLSHPGEGIGKWYIHSFVWDVVIHPCRIFNCRLFKSSYIPHKIMDENISMAYRKTAVTPVREQWVTAILRIVIDLCMPQFLCRFRHLFIILQRSLTRINDWDSLHGIPFSHTARGSILCKVANRCFYIHAISEKSF